MRYEERRIYISHYAFKTLKRAHARLFIKAFQIKSSGLELVHSRKRAALHMVKF